MTESGLCFSYALRSAPPGALVDTRLQVRDERTDRWRDNVYRGVFDPSVRMREADDIAALVSHVS